MIKTLNLISMKDNRFGRYTTAAIVIGGIIGTYFFSRPGRNKIKTKLANKRQKK